MFHKLIFFGRFAVFSCGFVFYELLIFLNLLQVVQAESELGGPGALARADAVGAPKGGP